MTIKTFLVEGMMCHNCKTHVENSIRTITGIEDVMADITSGQVRVSGKEIDNLQVKQLVEEAGYQYKGEVHTHAARGSDIWLS